jgi:enamine deaminase RidA (YjgF/YER057c/UK114 family)
MSVPPRFAPRLAYTRGTLACLIALAGCATAPDTITRYGDATTVYSTGAKVAPGAPLYFSAGMTAGEGAPASMKAQALLTLKKLGESLATAGVKPSEVLFVRAYLAPGADGKVDFAGWNEAWSETFGNAANPTKPARTTVAVPLLGRPSTLIEVEYVAAPAAGDELFMSSDKLGLPLANPMLKPYGTKEGRIYSGMGIKAGAGYYWTAGTLSALAKADAPATSAERFGDMKFQATSTLKRLQENLANVGLSFKDVIFLRAFLAPNKLGDGKFDYAGWNAAYDDFFNNPANPHKPARTTVTTPSFGGPGAQIEIEVITAFPGVPQASVNFDASTPATVNPNLKSYGAATSPIASGKALKPGSGLYFSAGAVPAVDGDMKTQALSTLGVLKERLAAAGMGFKDVIFLRAYVVPEADGNFDRKGWGEAYGSFFGTADQPQKPARTTIAVHSLPRPNWKIEIDVIAAQP